MAEVLTVTALNRYVKRLLDSNDLLFDLALQGEIANFVRNARSGHCYFSLRDTQSSVKAVMFKSDAQQLSFRPEEGMKVIVRCRVTLYERDGAFQIYVTDIFPDGVGAAQLAFEQLKAKLEAEGLFSPSRKQEIPPCPKCIGLVTSKTGAALQDILNVAGRRWPMIRFVLCPVSVQGFEAAEQIAAAITQLDAMESVECIIVARGGGSREDLWVFNAERIARAAATCETPLISAIGHEIDFTILDFVADLRAPTPSAAAELAVPDVAELYQKIYNLQDNIQKNMQKRQDLCYTKFNAVNMAFLDGAAQGKANQAAVRLAQMQTHITEEIKRKNDEKKRLVAHAAALTDSLSPYKTLARGYSMLTDEKGEIAAVAQLQEGQTIHLLSDCKKAVCLVQKIEEYQP